ncbi:MAG: DUF2721 domain-containing protein [Burkholderiaceae bacterium]|nr:DUF2721 domain-containing protein [Burkholderiaceae bacterium]MDO9089993.1 DUF2721 domain-containing protein [Burkholderiaceae bacterium]
MFFAADSSTVTHAIQLAVAPVFLLTAVSGMIGATAGRLARIIDRARIVEARLEQPDAQQPALDRAWTELGQLRTRGALANACIALLTICALLIGLTILALFLAETTDLKVLRFGTIGFLIGVFCFLMALLCFLAETLLATRLLQFGRASRKQ